MDGSTLNVRVSGEISDSLAFVYEKAGSGELLGGVLLSDATLKVSSYGNPASYKDSYTLLGTQKTPDGTFSTVVVDPVLTEAGFSISYTDKGVILARSGGASVPATGTPTGTTTTGGATQTAGTENGTSTGSAANGGSTYTAGNGNGSATASPTSGGAAQTDGTATSSDATQTAGSSSGSTNSTSAHGGTTQTAGNGSGITTTTPSTGGAAQTDGTATSSDATHTTGSTTTMPATGGATQTAGNGSGSTTTTQATAETTQTAGSGSGTSAGSTTTGGTQTAGATTSTLNGAETAQTTGPTTLTPTPVEAKPVVAETAPAKPVVTLPETATSTQKTVARALTSSDAAPALAAQIQSLSITEKAAALQQLSGEAHASVQSAAVQASIAVGNTVNDRLMTLSAATSSSPGIAPLGYAETKKPVKDARFASYEKPKEEFDPARFAVWGTGFGSRGKIDGENGLSAVDLKSGGLLAGVDGRVMDTAIVGVYAGYSRSAIDSGHSKSTGDNYHIGAYVGGGDIWTARAGIGYTWQKSDIQRSVPLLRQKLTAEYASQLFNIFGEVGVKLPYGSSVFEPFLNVSYTSLESDSFSEKGGSAALSVDKASRDSIFSIVGLRTSTNLDLGGNTAKLNGLIGWKHAYNGTQSASVARFSGGEAFNVSGTPLDDNAALIGLGLDVNFTNNAVLGVSYTGEISGKSHNHSLNTSLRAKF